MLNDMQAQLVLQEIESLHVELRRSQDHSRTQIIQEMISVRPALFLNVLFY
jgi:hypothetical protein